MLTIEDIRNPKRKSGFDHVNSASRSAKAQANQPNSSNTMWRGVNGGGHPENPNCWRGKTRRTPEEAAQDYCDYKNGATQATMTVTNTGSSKSTTSRIPGLMLNRANHPYSRSVTVAKPRKPKAPRKGTENVMGTVYLITERGNDETVKIGWSKDAGFARLRELQTGNPRLLVGLAEKAGTKLSEYKLHLAYEPANVLNEWFEVSDELLGEFDLTRQDFESKVGV